ncbi:hypothetical protein SAMN05444369_11044 [Capnocytophaga haemolytica]|jgi:hypothetical protein|uniref:Uncharacterized protein n=1 Tax=Capnocytophaga haemolytica TaxID=45243 RepID=A0AAX2GWM5_9FLAO|nr:hypothetical protein [Capnocytophaga haemolytica]AMD85419.1 hypothetical protein AXF12_07780 [Capnocytophaga haemolytica]SFO12726.1 hypothetical protein SAMN05444369_11044 [Capnocytophaga haemolytica]SNV01829.1 Uncharacterised protein [Capnocytophaga haemolytica]
MTVEVTAEVYPNEFSTKELLDELEFRIKNDDDFDEDTVLATFKKMFTLGRSLTEASKIEYFLDNLGRITETDLRNIVENQ